MHTEGHDLGKPEGVQAHPTPKIDAEHPGYETQDVNSKGIVYFLGGLAASVAVFFVLCFYIGKAINYSFVKEDGPPDKWHQYGNTHIANREDLISNPAMEQKDLQAITATFPTPRLDVDDGNQATADLHAREDLLLDHYSSDSTGTRIPIDRAMQLIVQRGLGSAPPPTAPKTLMAGDSVPAIHAPLTTGFARTGYELDTIEMRDQKNEYKAAEAKRAGKE
ncbi:MAG: hypothetical protein ABI147_13100 [Acidobacteriaceae bacterium]